MPHYLALDARLSTSGASGCISQFPNLENGVLATRWRALWIQCVTICDVLGERGGTEAAASTHTVLDLLSQPSPPDLWGSDQNEVLWAAPKAQFHPCHTDDS